MTMEIEGVLLFIKKIRLTDIESEKPGSTLNHFDLPSYYQYRVGSTGFGVWRELAAHQITTQWVLTGECPNFPLMYHSRIMPHTIDKNPSTEGDIDRIVAYWDGSSAIKGRLEAIKTASNDVVIFMEHMQQTLGNWLEVETPKGTLTESKLTRLESELNKVVSFMKSKGFIHLDCHGSNVMMKHDNLPYFIDFGLTMSREFELSSKEIAFLEKHRDYDHYLVISDFTMRLVTEAIVSAYGEEGCRDKAIAYITKDDKTIILPPAVTTIAERYRPICVLMHTFYEDLQNKSKSTPYPDEALAEEWVKINDHH
ncbi:MAG: hypothetical protein WCG42_02675 [Parachlamydiaceae bacterium]